MPPCIWHPFCTRALFWSGLACVAIWLPTPVYIYIHVYTNSHSDRPFSDPLDAPSEVNNHDELPSSPSSSEQSGDSPDGDDVGPSPRAGTTSRTPVATEGDASATSPSPPRPRPQSSGPAARFSPSELRRESVRLRTFQGWPVNFVSPAQLAKAGFIYTGSRDCVRCVFCG